MEYIWIFPFQWMHLDISSIYRTSAIKFKIKANELPKLKVFLFSYKGKKRRLQIVLNDSNFINREMEFMMLIFH